MKILNLPINQFVKITRDDNNLTLKLTPQIQNHVGTIHAGAQFILAESASGVYLSELFPDLKDRVIPLLRDSNIKYKKPALNTLRAYVEIEPKELKRFKDQFLKKSKASIKVTVKLKDCDANITAIATFSWIILKI